MERVPCATLQCRLRRFPSPTFPHPGGRAELRSEFDCNGTAVRVGIRFEKVRGYGFRAEGHRTARLVESAYNTLVEVRWRTNKLRAIDLAGTVVATVLAIVGIWWTREYWRDTPGAKRERKLWELWLGSRELGDSFLRVSPAAFLSITMMAAALWCSVGYRMTEGSALSSVFRYASLTLFVLASLCFFGLAPLLFLFNKPSWLVAPRYRGKPGALNLRGRRHRRRA